MGAASRQGGGPSHREAAEGAQQARRRPRGTRELPAPLEDQAQDGATEKRALFNMVHLVYYRRKTLYFALFKTNERRIKLLLH